VLLFVISLVLPNRYEIKRSVTLNCNKNKVFNYISDINNLNDWFYITKSLDTTIKFKFDVDTINKKSSVEWNGELMGQGVFQFTNFKNGELIDFKVSFENDKVIQKGKFKLSALGSNTKLIWIESGENGWNPINRIFGLFIDGFLGPDMEKSIKKIKSNLDC
jgi:hypothetical protein